VRPLWVVVERLRRLVEGVGIDQRATADPGSAEDQAVVEQVDPLDAVAAQPRARTGSACVSKEVAGRSSSVEARTSLKDADR
jgi:hypothetical protein